MLKQLIGKPAAEDLQLKPMFRRALWPLAIKALPALYGAGLVLFVIRILPPAEFGKYGIVFAYVNLLAVLTRGLWAIPLVTWAARGESDKVLGPVFWASVVTASLAASGALFVLPLLHAGGALPALAAAILLVLIPRELAYAMAQAGGRFGIAFALEAAYFLGSLAGFFALHQLSLLHSADVALATNLGCLVLSALIAVIAYPQLLHPSLKGSWSEVLSYAKWIGMMGVGEVYLQQGDALLLGAFIRPAELAPYLAARTLLRLYSLFSQAINFLTLPVASRLYASGQVARLRTKVNTVVRLLLLALLPVNIVVWFGSPYVIPWVLGDKYVQAVPYLQMLLFASFFEPVYTIYGNTLAGIGRPDLVARVMPWILISNAAALIMLIPNFGLWAAPVILVATYAVLAVIIAARARREFVRTIPL